MNFITLNFSNFLFPFIRDLIKWEEEDEECSLLPANPTSTEKPTMPMKKGEVSFVDTIARMLS